MVDGQLMGGHLGNSSLGIALGYALGTGATLGCDIGKVLGRQVKNVGDNDGAKDDTTDGLVEGTKVGTGVGKGTSSSLYKSKFLFVVGFLQSSASRFSPNSHLQMHVVSSHFDPPTLPKINSRVIF